MKIVKRVFAVVAWLSLAAAAAAHLLNDEGLAETIGSTAYLSIFLAALWPAGKEET